MYTILKNATLGLTMSGMRHGYAAVSSSPNENSEHALTKKLQKIKDDNSKTDAQKTDAQKTLLLTEFPGNLSAQLSAVHANKGAGNPIDGEGISLRFALVEAAKTQNSRDYKTMIEELDVIIKLNNDATKSQAEDLKRQLVTAKTNYETGVAVTKKVTEIQTSNLNREKYFADKNVSWTGLLSMIKMEQGALTGPDKSSSAALVSLMTKFNSQGWEASRETNKDDALLVDLQNAGYLRFSGTAGSLEYGHKVVAALREIQTDWEKEYKKIINGTEALDADKMAVPQATQFDNWKGDTSKVANFLADVSGDGILSQTNQVSRMGFLGIFGREDMNKKQLSELGAAKLLQDMIGTNLDGFFKKLGVETPKTAADIESARRALFLRVALADGNPDIIRDPSLADRVTNAQIREQTQTLEKNNKARLKQVTEALKAKNTALSPELLDQAGKSLLTAVDVGGLLVGTGVSLEELARNTKIDNDNPKVFTLLTAGKKWEKQLSKNLQGHLGAGGGAGVDSNGAFFAGAGVDAGIKLIMQDNGKLGVEKGNQTLELNAGIGTSLLGFAPVGTVELAYRWNDVISALQSSDANTRNFLKGLFKTDEKGDITMVDASTKTDAINALAGDDKYGVQDINMAMDYVKNQLGSKDLSSTEKVVAVQNFIENFARYNEIRNYQAKQGFHLAGVGFGVLAGPAVLAPFVRLIGQNIQAGYRVDAEKTAKLAETKSQIEFDPNKLSKEQADPKSAALLEQRGVTMTTNGRGIDVSKAKFAETKIIGDNIDLVYDNDNTAIVEYRPKSNNERLVTIVQTSRDMNGAETYTLLLTTAPAENKNEKIESSTKTETNTETFLPHEQKVLDSLVRIGSLPDTLKGDKSPLRKKYPIMESANDNGSGVYTQSLENMQQEVSRMGQDKKLMQYLNGKGIVKDSPSFNNPAFLRAFLGTILALTSGSVKSRELGTRIGSQNNPTTADEVNKYLETKGLITAELAALKAEYPGLNMTESGLKDLMKFAQNSTVNAQNIPTNMYAESAYAKGEQNGTAMLPPGARIAGDMQPYNNDVIRNALIAKLEVPKNLETKGFTKENYVTLLKTGTVTVKNTQYTATKSELNFARSAVTTDRTCFNAVFAITVPTDVTWKENTVKSVDPKAVGLAIGTDTILSGATKAVEASTIFIGPNQRKPRKEEEPTPPGPTPPGPKPTPEPAGSTPIPNNPNNPVTPPPQTD